MSPTQSRLSDTADTDPCNRLSGNSVERRARAAKLRPPHGVARRAIASIGSTVREDVGRAYDSLWSQSAFLLRSRNRACHRAGVARQEGHGRQTGASRCASMSEWTFGHRALEVFVSRFRTVGLMIAKAAPTRATAVSAVGSVVAPDSSPTAAGPRTKPR